MKVLFDTNVVLDLLLERTPFVEDARALFVLVENGKIEGYLCATTVTTLHYLIEKETDKTEADEVIAMLLGLFEVAPVTHEVLSDACTHNGSDYEDSVIYTSAGKMHIDYIVTRDKKGFSASRVSVLNPKAFLAFFETKQNIL